MPEQTGAVEHLMPPGVEPGPVEVTIVVPSLNEEITVGEFVDWCKEGLERAGVRGQILIVDSSTDKTPDIVLAHGGEVLRTPKRGLGRAYIEAANYIRGQWIVMGDADLTYDFRELMPFVEAFRKGAEFVMGSRFRDIGISREMEDRIAALHGGGNSSQVLQVRLYHFDAWVVRAFVDMRQLARSEVVEDNDALDPVLV